MNPMFRWPATPEFRAAYEQHRGAGKGIVGLHSGLWINWRDWPQRACVGAALEDGTLVEIVLVALAG